MRIQPKQYSFCRTVVYFLMTAGKTWNTAQKRPYKNYTEGSLNEALHARRHYNFVFQENTLYLKSQEKHSYPMGRAPVFTNEELQFVRCSFRMKLSASNFYLMKVSYICDAGNATHY